MRTISPSKAADYLKWSEQGAKDGELVFVSGNPGLRRRGWTRSRHLEFLRDRSNPWALIMLFRREVLLRVYSERSDENPRRAEDQLIRNPEQPQSVRGHAGGAAGSGVDGAEAGRGEQIDKMP